jgi:lipopolysaccharide/colanic/teichoic acid biosynthesis glycosyltransferase
MCGTTVPRAEGGGSPRAAKRAFDVALGVPLCLVAVPLMVLLAGALWVQHHAAPFFVHDRIGRHGRRIPIPKLRTLPPSTPRYADKTTHELTPASPLAGFLRRSHLDELPQLFLVPLGRLSLVGPRPRMLSEAEHFGDERYDRVRTSVDQGCTGLWQISVDGGGRVSDSPQYDYFYAHHRTLRLDLWILWRTAIQILGARPVTLDDVPAWTLHAEAPHPAEAECHLSPALLQPAEV